MNKIAISMIIVLAAALPVNAQLGSQSFGQPGTEGEIDAANAIFSNPGMLPDHPFYFFKRMTENIQLVLANDTAKPKLHVQFAMARLAEAQKLSERNMTKLAENELNEFDEELDKADKGNYTDVFLKSDVVLAGMLNMMPQAPVQHAIDRMMERRGQMYSEMAERMGELRQKISERENKTEDLAQDEIEYAQQEITQATTVLSNLTNATTASRMLGMAKQKLDAAEHAIDDGKFGEALGQATAANRIARTVTRIADDEDEQPEEDD